MKHQAGENILLLNIKDLYFLLEDQNLVPKQLEFLIHISEFQTCCLHCRSWPFIVASRAQHPDLLHPQNPLLHNPWLLPSKCWLRVWPHNHILSLLVPQTWKGQRCGQYKFFPSAIQKFVPHQI